MATKCFAPVRGRVARITRVDSCGRPIYGECSQVVTDGIITVSLTANIEEGEEISVTNFAGKTCVQDSPCPTLNNYGVEIEFCQVDPDFFNIATGQPVNEETGMPENAVTNPAGDTIGFGIDGEASTCANGFALEVWTGIYTEQACGEDAGEGQWGYILLPFVQGGVFGDFEIGNDAISFSLSNASTKTGSTWGVGPYEIQTDGSGADPAVGTGLYQPIPTTRHVHIQTVDMAPPEAACGCQPLEEPDEVPATGAVAGSPGFFTPAGATQPADLAAMSGIVASPTTAWADGEYVELADGSQATWDGDEWVASGS